MPRNTDRKGNRLDRSDRRMEGKMVWWPPRKNEFGRTIAGYFEYIPNPPVWIDSYGMTYATNDITQATLYRPPQPVPSIIWYAREWPEPITNKRSRIPMPVARPIMQVGDWESNSSNTAYYEGVGWTYKNEWNALDISNTYEVYQWDGSPSYYTIGSNYSFSGLPYYSIYFQFSVPGDSSQSLNEANRPMSKIKILGDQMESEVHMAIAKSDGESHPRSSFGGITFGTEIDLAAPNGFTGYNPYWVSHVPYNRTGSPVVPYEATSSMYLDWISFFSTEPFTITGIEWR